MGHSAWRSPLLALIALILASLACSLDTSPSSSEKTAEELQREPLVVLLAPSNNSTYAEGVQVTFHAVAQDPQMGVTRIEFRVDDVPVGDVAPALGGGQPSLDAMIDWIATGKTGHLVTVEAFRSDGSSLGLSDARIQVTDRPTAQLPSGSIQTSLPAAPGAPADSALSGQTPAPGQTSGALPKSPTQMIVTPPPTNTTASGQPAVRVNTPTLNVRQGPGTNYPVVGVLSQGDQVPLVGRNADSSWWAVAYGSGTAWVFAGLTTTEGSTERLPLVAAPPPPPATNTPVVTPAPQNPPDLVIDSVRLDPPTPQANVTFTVYATVRNAGGTASPQADAMLTFQPGDERSPADPRIPGLLAGQSAEVLFRVTLKGSGTGLTGVIDVDVYDAVDEGGTGEANNRATVTYNVNP